MTFGDCMFLLSLLCSLCSFCVATDTITASQFIKDGDDGVVSVSNTFKLGFFSPGSPTNRYVGIWRNNVPALKPVWVANRNKPLINDFSGVVTISEDGNIVVLNGQQQIVWSSNVSDIRVRNSTAQLADDGNLMLRGSTSGEIFWESFNNLTDTFMPKMRLTANARTGERMMLTSWKSTVDPSVGAFSGGLNPNLGNPEVFIWNESRPYWRSGPWNRQVFIGIPDMKSFFSIGGFDIEKDVNGTVTLSYEKLSYLTHFVLNSDGILNQFRWDSDKKSWVKHWKSRKSDCDVYGYCGDFGICDSRNSPICSCLNGFQPKVPDEWSRGNWVSGCVRKSLLKCERQRKGGELGKEDGFFKVDNVKVPDFVDWSYSSASEERCRDLCFNNCSCTAYAYYPGIYCMLWSDKLTDIQKFSSGGADLYIRLAHSELDGRRKLKAGFILIIVVGAITICICSFYAWFRWIAKYPEKKRQREEAHPTSLDQILLKDKMNKKLQDLPLFKLQELTTATANFDVSNMLGEGGFGPVYKGKLPDGQEIAVKRLSRASGQGLEEFMNEVVVISNLQHRNLVRLLGCCVEEEEKILVYEYMPNKSLDAFLFDPLRHGLLDWNRRFKIVEGICRGLLYLHRDSRLRIIHRDLKASNILLDHELNPKISDFGMARIFGVNEHQANTRRVMGTFGYMSPEYATRGQFSEKSDIFSLGVLLLEIVSGRRNTSFYGDDRALSLLGFAWKLWNEGNIVDLMDPHISNSEACLQVEILRCIHVGLLCVEELAKDRPTVSTVISMLNCEIADLPAPKHPAFAERQNYLETEACKMHSINNVTVSILTAR